MLHAYYTGKVFYDIFLLFTAQVVVGRCSDVGYTLWGWRYLGTGG